MGGLTVDAHAPRVMHAVPYREVWVVECECGWIGPSCYWAETALRAHARHVEAVS